MLEFISKEAINKGWSCDKKYCVTTADGTKYLLRVTPIEKSASREKMYLMQKEVEKLGVPMCKTVDFDKCDEGVYTLQTWIDGKDAEDVVPKLPDSEQYALGLESGRILKKIHSIPAPADQPDWEPRINSKADLRIRKYNECPLKYDNGQAFIDFINENRYLLKGRPQVFQHGDYHIGNMMIENGKIVIIDFDRYDFGDPWEEFKSITWCAQASPLFASGMVNGYFNKDVPIEFWKLLALYISLGTITSLPWAIPYGEGEVQTMRNLANEVLEWYDNMQNPIPTWFLYENYLLEENIKIDFKNVSFSVLDKTVFDSIANILFDILADNMEKIAPSGNDREDDRRLWLEGVNEGLSREERQIVLIKDENSIIGFFQYYVNTDTFMMEEIQIKPMYQGKNVFRKLYGFLLNNLKDDIEFVEAYANIHNSKSIGILGKLGLSKVGMNKTGSCYHFKGKYTDLKKWYYSK